MEGGAMWPIIWEPLPLPQGHPGPHPWSPFPSMWVPHVCEPWPRQQHQNSVDLGASPQNCWQADGWPPTERPSWFPKIIYTKHTGKLLKIIWQLKMTGLTSTPKKLNPSNYVILQSEMISPILSFFICHICFFILSVFKVILWSKTLGRGGGILPNSSWRQNRLDADSLGCRSPWSCDMRCMLGS